MPDYHHVLFPFIIFSICFVPLSLPAQGSFTDVTQSAGINHQFKVYEGLFGGGICVFDFNNDGFEDLFLTSGMHEDQLYLNKGDGTFENIYEGSGLEITRHYVTQGVCGADVNRDGWVDLYITTLTTKDSIKTIPREKNLLLLNNGDMTFRDATAEFGLDDLYSFSTAASFGDINADGYPDLYVGNYFQDYQGDLVEISDATIASSHQTAKGYLLLNKKGRKFRNVYEDYGMTHKGFGFGGVFTDFDNDGDQDLLVHHDFGYKRTPNLLLENFYPKAAFRDVAEPLNMDLKINGMGAAAGDINEDGLMDYFISNIRFNRLMVSQGPGQPYTDELKQRGMSYVTISWSANFADFDHDGDLDLFVNNGDLNPNCVPMGNFFFENDNGNFKDIARAMNVQDYGLGRGSVVFDMDNDGDLDILQVNQGAIYDYPTESITRLYRNDWADGNWAKIALRGTQAESHGLGSRVEAYVGGRRMIREIDGGGGSHISQNSTIAHFGLGDASVIDSVVVRWTGGHRQLLTDQPVNTLITVVQTEKSSSTSGWYVLPLMALVTGVFWIFRRRKPAVVSL